MNLEMLMFNFFFDDFIVVWYFSLVVTIICSNEILKIRHYDFFFSNLIQFLHI
ncbi:unnamed protein product [Brugia pahangi]|uniref:7TM_GPCR_Srx domain-containing protein n=1 Tax=Brugia pahangi TaxID=6280 RepID=A0A0N4T600_BRUPA|nr:unnamed protein product [Brugia pahangi]